MSVATQVTAAAALDRGTNPLPQQGVFFPHSITGLIGGYQAGYNLQLPNNWLIGVEADISFPSPLDRPKLVPAPFNTTFDYFATARGRIGYAFGTWLPYVTGGLAWDRTHIDLNDTAGDITGMKARMHLGWVAGAGVEYALGGKLERQDRIQLHRSWPAHLWTRRCPAARPCGRSKSPRGQTWSELQVLGYALDTRFGNQAASASGIDGLECPWPDHAHHAGLSVVPHAVSGREQPSRRRSYTRDMDRGCLSRMAAVGKVESFTSIRNWHRASVLAYAGPCGLLQWRSAEGRARNTQNFVHNAISSARHSVSAANRKMLPTPPINCQASATSTALRSLSGDLPWGDYFDGNSYAKDPRADFMNWAMWASAAYDFPADLPGFTRGAVVELNRKGLGGQGRPVSGAVATQQRCAYVQDRRRCHRIRRTP